MQKARYEIDPYNRLVVAGSGTKNDFPKFRKVLDGQFKIDGSNNLSYHIKAPLSKSENIPHQVKFKGKWSLTDEHELRLTMDKSGRETFGDRITLQGEILDADEGSLSFAITTKTNTGAQSTYVLNLSGSWKADENNRLSFYVNKENGPHDILAFNGAWQVNKDHQIVYQYEKARLLRKKRESHALILKGYWDIKDRLRISYLLSGSTDSAFNFTATAGIFKEDYIEYKLGIGTVSKAKPSVRTITLFGEWKLEKDIGLVFEIKYEDGKARAIVFGADARLTDNDTVAFSLKNSIENTDMGVALELSRKILKGDGEAFLRLLGSRGESAIYAGAAWRW
jgi:hypothetical protein